MPVRNGLLSTLRAKGRTALFTLLILVLTVALALGLGLWAYCGGLLAQMEEQYTSVALVEYMGEDYPDENAADPAARAALASLDDAALSAVDGVDLWERTQSVFVSIDGYKHPSEGSPYENSAVVVATITPEFALGRAPVAKEDLPESRAVLTVEIAEDGYSYTFILPELGPLDLPYYYLDPDTGLYQRQRDSGEGSTEEPEGPYVLLHRVYVPNGWYPTISVMGELPEKYDPDVLQELLDSALYEYYPDEDRYIGCTETVLSPTSFGRISEALYSPHGAGSMICYFDAGSTAFLPERGTQYLLHGAFVSGSNGARHFQIQPFPDSDADPWLELSGNDDPALTDSIFVGYAERYRLYNNTALLTASDDIAALELFQQGTLYLADGRFPQAGEAGVCLVSGSMAEYMKVGVGDTISLEILDSDPELRADVSAAGDRRSLTIVGVTNLRSDYANRLWASAAEGGFAAPLFGYSLGMAVLDDRKAVQAADALSAMLPIGVQLTLYDQGYAAAARPIQAMESAAQAITLAAACGALAVLVLFALLFVGRQRETVGVLVSLGTPKGKIRLWLLSGAAVVAGAAALVGAFIGSQTLSGVVTAAVETVERLYATDTRYSEAAVGVVKESAEAGTLPGWPAPTAGVAVFLAGLLLCLIFLRHARKENAPKKGKVTVRVPKGRTSTVGRGPLRFAALSARRGGRRSVVVIAAALVLTLFMSLLSASTQGWEDQVDSLYADSELEGRVVSLNGRKQTGLVIPMRDIQQIWGSGYLGDISASIGWHYDGASAQTVPSVYASESTSWLSDKPSLYAVNSLSAAAEFYYTDRPEVQWLEGWDESCLADDSHPSMIGSIYACLCENGYLPPDYTYPVLAGSRFLADNGLELGDTLTVKLYMPMYVSSSQLKYVRSGQIMVEMPVDLQVVGSFTSIGAKDNVYVPLSLWCSQEWLYGGEGREIERDLGRIEDLADLERWLYFFARFETCRFTLSSAYELEDLRGWLAEKGYSQVGVTDQNRVTILLRDQSFVETVGGLDRYISFSNILFPVLFAVVGLLGFIISWLTVSSRRMELAIMRGLGASPRRAFSSFFLEQAALCLTGGLIGALAMTLLYRSGAVWMAAAGFLACYLAGCALSVLAAGKTNLMLLLSERE